MCSSKRLLFPWEWGAVSLFVWGPEVSHWMRFRRGPHDRKMIDSQGEELSTKTTLKEVAFGAVPNNLNEAFGARVGRGAVRGS